MPKKRGGGQFYERNPFKRNFRKSQSFAQKSEGVNFSKEILLNEICVNLKFLPNKVWGVGQFKKRNPLKRNFLKSQEFAQKSGDGRVNFQREIPLKQISENSKRMLNWGEGGKQVKKNKWKVLLNLTRLQLRLPLLTVSDARNLMALL